MSEHHQDDRSLALIIGGVLTHFEGYPAACKWMPLSGGLINDTFRVNGEHGAWVLQRINPNVFPDPAKVMLNMRCLQDHVGSRHGRASRLSLPVIRKTRDGADFMMDSEGALWRGLSYIPDAMNLSAITERKQAVELGRALGWFHQITESLDAGLLADTLPGFHVAPGYLAELDRRLKVSDLAGALPREILAFIEHRRDRIGLLESAKNGGNLRVRVMHGDPKMDNVLFSCKDGCAVSIVDLDTVKPGLIHYDLGDCFRSSCNVSGEGGRGRVDFDVAIFGAVLEGYLDEASSSLTLEDMDYLYASIWLLPFELGIRFLSDHLMGDSYFKVGAPGENLERALRQFDLVRAIETQQNELESRIACARKRIAGV